MAGGNLLEVAMPRANLAREARKRQGLVLLVDSKGRNLLEVAMSRANFVREAKKGQGWALLVDAKDRALLFTQKAFDEYRRHGLGEYEFQASKDSSGRWRATEAKFIPPAPEESGSTIYSVPPQEVLRCLTACLNGQTFSSAEEAEKTARWIAWALKAGLEAFYADPFAEELESPGGTASDEDVFS
jgi:hypothetical protein